MPSAWKPSVTVAAVVERDGRFLFVEEETDAGLRINQPAGHLDPGESLLDAAVRETLEETACRFTPAHLLGVYFWRAANGITYARFAFTGDASAPEPGRKLDHGIVRTLWLTPDELRARAAAHRSPLVMRCVDDHLRGRRFPLDLIFTHASVISHASDASPPLQGEGREWGWGPEISHGNPSPPLPPPLEGEGKSAARSR